MTRSPGASPPARGSNLPPVWPQDLPARPSTDPAWLVTDDGFNLAREHEVESLFTVANGYAGSRGSLAEGSSLSLPGTFVAGVYAFASPPDAVPELAVLPDWTRLRITIDGHELALETGETLEHRRVLDLRQGILWREWRHRDPAGRVTRLGFLRLASLADRHLLLQSLALTTENYSGRLRLESLIEQPTGAASNSSAGLPLVSLASRAPAPGSVVLTLRAPGTELSVAVATADLVSTARGAPIDPVLDIQPGMVAERWDWAAEIDQSYRLDRLVSISTSRDTAHPDAAAVARLERLRHEPVERVVAAHVAAWESRWQSADVVIDGDADAQRAVRLGLYHLIAAADPADERVSIGARALTGAVYKGHVFWDTEIYLLPFYSFTWPAAARALLMYRYHTLPPARDKARKLGYRGALYAWESADSGRETTPPLALTPEGEVVRIRTGEQEHHISADVAYAVWQYWQVSGDDAFFRDAGAEILLEAARFWASRGRLEADGRYHIRQVIGPDEYHESVDDNAYTNVMAQWTLERGAETARLCQERWPERWPELAQRLRLDSGEPSQWLELAAVMETGFDPDTGLIEQFRGYFDLEDIDLAAYAQRSAPMDVLLGRRRIQQSQVIKQADVVLLLYLLWDRFTPEVREANFRYYEPRTGHGSSLSPSIYALVAARLGDLALAERYFRQAAAIDLDNTMGNAAGGVHAAALGGLWQAAVCGCAGLRLRGGGLVLDPHLLPHWDQLRFPLQWRGRRLDTTVAAQPARIELRLDGEAPMVVALDSGADAALIPGRRYQARREPERWSDWQEVPG